MTSRRRIAVLAAIALTGLLTVSACSSASSGAPVSEADLSGSPVSAKDDMTSLCEQFVAEALPLEAAVALAEASGYTTRVGTVDGEPQAVTTDLREDRFTFDVEGGLVTKCTIG